MSSPKVRLRFNHWLPNLTGYHITIYPYVLFADSEDYIREQNTLLRHEATHFGQVVGYGWLRFYLSYLVYYLAGCIRYRQHKLAYEMIPYEIEARSEENDLWRLRHYDWGFVK